MRSFTCSVCGQLLFFDNSICLRCGSDLGFDPATLDLGALALDPAAADYSFADGRPGRFRSCANKFVARCNWLVPMEDLNPLCASCRLTKVRPNDADLGALALFADAEVAKRRLLHQLLALGLPVVDKAVEPRRGLAFDLLSPSSWVVITGHEDGLITIDLSESDDVHREAVRVQLGERYRTLLGHLRHEIGHYYWTLLVADAGRLDSFRVLFGDERAPYEEAKDRHYTSGGAPDWSTDHVSQYAAMHPWEDWAETFAHYLHLRDGLESASAFGMEVGEPAARTGRQAVQSSSHLEVAPMVGEWLALTMALNAMSQSIGQHDLYPFLLPPHVIEKLDFVHHVVVGAAEAKAAPAR